MKIIKIKALENIMKECQKRGGWWLEEPKRESFKELVKAIKQVKLKLCLV